MTLYLLTITFMKKIKQQTFSHSVYALKGMIPICLISVDLSKIFMYLLVSF